MRRTVLLTMLAAASLSLTTERQSRAAKEKGPWRVRYEQAVNKAFDKLSDKIDQGDKALLRIREVIGLKLGSPLVRFAGRNLVISGGGVFRERTRFGRPGDLPRILRQSETDVTAALALLSWDPGNHLARSLQRAAARSPELFRDHGKRLPPDLALKITGTGSSPGDFVVQGRSPSTGARVKMIANTEQVLSAELSFR